MNIPYLIFENKYQFLGKKYYKIFLCGSGSEICDLDNLGSGMGIKLDPG
jgi:hypothetical protein